MKMSCNGCRVLRKGCNDNCSIRPCLHWIKNPDSQSNATLFLAKFYGRAGLINLIDAGPLNLRPAIFRSLLYEACGRIVNPIYGSVGLLSSGRWHLCQAAVEAVLMGAPIVQISSESAASTPVPPLKAHDIRHVGKDCDSKPGAKRSGVKRSRAELDSTVSAEHGRVFQRARSHESSCSHATTAPVGSMVSADTIEASHVSQGEPAEDSEVELELTLGFQPSGRVSPPARHAAADPGRDLGVWDDGDTCRVDVGFELA